MRHGATYETQDHTAPAHARHAWALGMTSKYYRKPLELYESACAALQEHYDKMGEVT